MVSLPPRSARLFPPTLLALAAVLAVAGVVVAVRDDAPPSAATPQPAEQQPGTYAGSEVPAASPPSQIGSETDTTVPPPIEGPEYDVVAEAPAEDARAQQNRGGESVDAESTEIGAPVRVTIPAIDVDSQVVPVGLKTAGAMDVPDFGVAGWYRNGPRPGARGPAVVAAHMDSTNGPDVFFRLRELERGDEVTVEDAEGGTVTFVVESREQTAKDELPAERIWAPTTEPALRLITCDGVFDRSSGHYRDNLIVYLSLADSH